MISLKPIPKPLATDLEYQYLEIDILTSVKPEYLKTFVIPKLDFDKGLVIGGNAPIWFYSFFVTELLLGTQRYGDFNFNHLEWAAIYDSKLGAVVFWGNSLAMQISEGDIIPFA